MKIGNLKIYIYIYIYYSEKKSTKLSWPISAKSDFFFIQKEKKHKIIMAHECQI